MKIKVIRDVAYILNKCNNDNKHIFFNDFFNFILSQENINDSFEEKSIRYIFLFSYLYKNRLFADDDSLANFLLNVISKHNFLSVIINKNIELYYQSHLYLGNLSDNNMLTLIQINNLCTTNKKIENLLYETEGIIFALTTPFIENVDDIDLVRHDVLLPRIKYRLFYDCYLNKDTFDINDFLKKCYYKHVNYKCKYYDIKPNLDKYKYINKQLLYLNYKLYYIAYYIYIQNNIIYNNKVHSMLPLESHDANIMIFECLLTFIILYNTYEYDELKDIDFGFINNNYDLSIFALYNVKKYINKDNNIILFKNILDIANQHLLQNPSMQLLETISEFVITLDNLKNKTKFESALLNIIYSSNIQNTIEFQNLII